MLNDLVTIVIPVIITLAAGMGGALMLSTNPEQHRAAKWAFYVAGISLWMLGVSIGLHSEGPLPMKIAVAALIGAFAAAGAVYAVSLTHAQEKHISGENKDRSAGSTNQNNSGAPNFNVPGSGNTFNYNSPPPAPSETRDPDGLYQLGQMVATVSGAHVDVGNSLVTFDTVTSQGKLDTNREIEYRDYVIKCDGLAGAPRPGVRVGMFIGMTVGAKCTLIRKR